MIFNSDFIRVIDKFSTDSRNLNRPRTKLTSTDIFGYLEILFFDRSLNWHLNFSPNCLSF